MTRWLAGVIAIAAAACGGGGASQHPQQPAPERRACEQVADHLVGLMSAAQKVDPVELDPFRNAITRRCIADTWGADARTCLVGATTLSDGNRCEGQLTEAQVAALQHDLQVELDKLKSGP